MTERLGRFPSPGDRATVDGVAVEVEEVDGVTVASLLVRPVDALAESAIER